MTFFCELQVKNLVKWLGIISKLAESITQTTALNVSILSVAEFTITPVKNK